MLSTEIKRNPTIRGCPITSNGSISAVYDTASSCLRHLSSFEIDKKTKIAYNCVCPLLESGWGQWFQAFAKHGWATLSSTNLPLPSELLPFLDWRQIVELAPDVILLIDREGKVLYVSNIHVPEALDRVIGTTIFDQSLPDFHRSLREHLARVFEERRETQVEFIHLRTDNTLGWWSANAAPIIRDDKVVAAIVSCHDIGNLQSLQEEKDRAVRQLQDRVFREKSELLRARELLAEEIEERRRVEASLRESELRYRTLVDMARNAIASINYDGIFLFLNPVAARSLGGEPENFIGKSMFDLFPPEIANRQYESVRRVIDSRTPEAIESLSFVDGSYRWFMTQIQPLIEADNSCTSVLLEATDIDSRVKATLQMRRERNFSNSILQTANCLIICLDARARITVFNRECELVTGYSAAEVIGRHWPSTFLPPDSQFEGLSDFAAWVQAHPTDSYEGPILTKTGETRTILWSNSSFTLEDTGELVAIAIGVDITDRYRLAQQLRTAEYRHRAVLSGIPDLVFIFDREGRYLEFEGGNPEDLPIPPGQFLGRTVSEVLGAELGDRLVVCIERALTTDVAQTLEYELETPAGLNVFEARIAPCGNDQCVVVSRNITKRRAAEAALRRNESELRFLIDHLQAGVIVHGPDTTITHCNLAAARMLAQSVEELLGRRADLEVWPLLSEDGTVLAVKDYPVNRVIAAGKPVENLIVGVKLGDSNRDLYAMVNAFPEFAPGGSLLRVVVCFVDITDRRLAEKQLEIANRELRLNQIALEDRNAALRVFLEQSVRERDDLRNQLFEVVTAHILPIISRMRHRAEAHDLVDIDLLESLLSDLASGDGKLSRELASKLTPRELEICKFIKLDMDNKDMAKKLDLSIRTIEKFRQSIRSKLGLKGGKSNLTSYLKSR